MKSVLANASHNDRSLLCPFIIIQVCVTGKKKIWACGLFVYDFSARGTALAEPLAFLFSLGNKNKRKKEVWMDIRSQNLAIVLKIPGKRFCLLFTCR